MPNYRSLVAGGFFSDSPMDKSVPASIRTNNPGAINSGAWLKSLPGYVDAKMTTKGNVTVIFEAPEYGVAAWWELLFRYRESLGASKFSLRNIIFRYCGKGREKEAVDYLQFVSSQTSVHGDSIISLDDFQGLCVLARTFFRFEAGRPSPLQDKQILLGFKLARDRLQPPAAPEAMAARVKRASRKMASIEAAAAAEAPATLRQLLAQIAKAEGEQRNKWTGPSSEAEKYLAPFREPMRKLGHLGKDPVFFNWCAAFVTWCSRKAGYSIPDQPTGFYATMALVEAWKHWAKQQGYLKTKITLDSLQEGDIVLYEWSDGDSTLDHIGVFLQKTGNKTFKAAEGNAPNVTAITERKFSTVAGIVRLPD